MPTLFIDCPVTGKPTPTGIATDVGSNLSGFSNNSVGCTHCGQMHTWNGKDAYWLDQNGRRIRGN